MLPLPVGKLPLELLAGLLADAPQIDPRILVGPGTGLDCAVVDVGSTLLVFKSDPITFASDEIGWYAVQVNTNDIATSAATPRWLLFTLLLPEKKTTRALAEDIFSQVYRACEALGISVIGGHTEVTYGLDRPLVMATMIGEVSRERLVTPRGAQPGDALLLTKGVPVEATALLAREMPERLSGLLSADEIKSAQEFLYSPGISVYEDARLAVEAGGVTAMHDPTEGGLAAALWEMALASGRCLVFEPARVPIPALSRRVCAALGIDPLAAIASGALLIAARPEKAAGICQALDGHGIACAQIGVIESGAPGVWQRMQPGLELLARPERDEVARLFAGE